MARIPSTRFRRRRCVITSYSIHYTKLYELIRRILKLRKTPLDQPFGKGTLADALMAPTQIYVKLVLKLLEAGIPVSYNFV